MGIPDGGPVSPLGTKTNSRIPTVKHSRIGTAKVLVDSKLGSAKTKGKENSICILNGSAKKKNLQGMFLPCRARGGYFGEIALNSGSVPILNREKSAVSIRAKKILTTNPDEAAENTEIGLN